MRDKIFGLVPRVRIKQFPQGDHERSESLEKLVILPGLPILFLS